MTTYKKLVFGLVLALSLGTLGLITPKHAFASATLPQINECKSTMKFQDFANITCTYAADGVSPGATVTFTDGSPTDGTPRYDISSPADAFCQPGGGQLAANIYLKGGGISLASAGTAITASFQAASVVINSSGTAVCQNQSSNGTVGGTGNIKNLLQWGGSGAGNLSNVTGGPLSGLSFSRLAGQDPSTSRALLQQNFDPTNCTGYILAVDNPGGGNAIVYKVGSGSGTAFANEPDLKKIIGTKCDVVERDFGLGNGAFSISGTVPDLTDTVGGQVGQLCDPNQTPPSGYTCGGCTGYGATGPTGCTLSLITTTPTPTTAAPSCASNFDFGFEWVMCPALRLADNASGSVNTFVENQLCFNTAGATSSTGNDVCAGNSLLENTPNNGVKVAWSTFKNLATGLLVLVMLVMVISQAMGGATFDAYTIRKVLPRLVAVAIIMQISWDLAKYAIDISNDLGKGIQSLMYAPFGGPASMNLDKIFGSAISGATTGANDKFALFTGLAVAGALIANLPGLLLLALFVVIALFTAFFVLLLRKLFIVMFVILIPLALIASVLPGTEKYWKLWRENFTKLLLMFPMIMALISAGRIFAYIVGTGNLKATAFSPHLAVAHLGPLPVPYIASVTTFADVFIILVAWFAPYFMLPQTFKWGGTFMGSAANLINKRITEPATKRSKESVKGMTERYRGAMATKYDPDGNPFGRTVFRLGSGHFNPLPGPLGGRRSRALAIQAGDKYKDEAKAEADAVVNRKADIARANGIEAVDYMRDANGGLMLDLEGNAIPEAKRDASGQVQYDASGAPIAAKRMKEGVEAYKQSLVESSQMGTSREKEMAITRLLKTSSWPEIQNAVASNGKRVPDSSEWQKTVTTNNELYPQVQGKRYDLAPHIMNLKYTDDRLTKLGYGLATSGPDAGKYVNRDGKTVDKGGKLSEGDRVRVAATEYMGPEDFASQSQGFWDEAYRRGGTLAAKDIQTRLAEVSSTGQYGLQTLGRMRGGDSEKAVHRALGGALDANGNIPAGDNRLEKYIQHAQAVASHDPVTGPAPAPPVF